MEYLGNTLHEKDQVKNHQEIGKYLLEAAKWGKFLAILGYVLLGLCMLLVMFIMFGLLSISKPVGVGLHSFILSVGYIFFAALYYIPITYLYRFSVQMKEAVTKNDEILYVSGFENLKSFFKFIGIFTVVILSLYFFAILIAVPVMMLLG